MFTGSASPMVVLIECPTCEERFPERGAELPEIDDGCPACGETVIAPPWGRATIHEIVEEKDTAGLKVVLDKGADPARTDENGETPLHRAAEEGHAEGAEVLLENGAWPDMTDDTGRAPLHLAASGIEDNPKAAEQLLEEGATVDVDDKTGQTPLSLAVKDENPKVAEVLIEAGAEVTRADMEAIVALQSPTVRAEVAAHPDAPQDLIDLMVRAGSKPDLSGLSEEESGSLTAQERARLREAGPYGKRLVAAHPETPLAEIAELAEAVPGAVAQNPSKEAFALEAPGWMEELSPEAWAGLCAEEQALESWLRRGAKHEDPDVRIAVAKNEAAPPEVLSELSADAEETVPEAAATNPSSPN